MPVDSRHEEYMKYINQWVKCRDAVEGEDAVKEAGEAYLPRLRRQDDSEYESYKGRAMFFEAASRTVSALSGTVLRLPVRVTGVGEEELEEGEANTALENIGIEGENFDLLVKLILDEQLIQGRVGALIDSNADSDDEKPYIALYFAENIINWKEEMILGRRMLTEVRLLEVREEPNAEDEWTPNCVEYIRVLKLKYESDDRGVPSFIYTQELYRKEEKLNSSQQMETSWALTETTAPMMKGGKKFEALPFIFINANDLKAKVTKSPINGLVNLNFSHYRSSADLEHGRHFTALPTPWAAGFDVKNDEELVVGSSVAWVTDNPSAQAGYLEFSGAGLTHLQTALTEKEKLMAVLGSRLLEEQKLVGEAAETVALRQAGEQSVLMSIASTLEEALKKLMKLYFTWQGVPAEQLVIEVNKDYNVTGLDTTMLSTLMSAVQQGHISWDTFFYNLQRGEVFPPNRTQEEEKELIDMGGPNKKPGAALTPELIAKMKADGVEIEGLEEEEGGNAEGDEGDEDEEEDKEDDEAEA